MRFSLRSLLLLTMLIGSTALFVVSVNWEHLENWEQIAVAKGTTGAVVTPFGIISDEPDVDTSAFGFHLVLGSGSGSQSAMLECNNPLHALCFYDDPRFDVNDVSASRDGRRVVTASDDGSVRIWDSTNGNLLAILKGHTGGVKQARYSTDGTFILTRGDEIDLTSRVWRKCAPEESRVHICILAIGMIVVFGILFVRSIWYDRRMLDRGLKGADISSQSR